MGDRRKCQTYTASPAEPGGLPVMLGSVNSVKSGVAGAGRGPILRIGEKKKAPARYVPSKSIKH